MPISPFPVSDSIVAQFSAQAILWIIHKLRYPNFLKALLYLHRVETWFIASTQRNKIAGICICALPCRNGWAFRNRPISSCLVTPPRLTDGGIRIRNRCELRQWLIPRFCDIKHCSIWFLTCGNSSGLPVRGPKTCVTQWCWPLIVSNFPNCGTITI